MTVLIFLDTCSLLDSCWSLNFEAGVESFIYSKSKEQRFWNQELGRLYRSGRIILPKRNQEELQKFANNPKRDLALRSNHVLQILSMHIKNGELEIVGDNNDPFADAILLSVALKFRTREDLLFITQDRDLARDLVAISRFRSVHSSKNFDVKRIADDGSLERFDLRSRREGESEPVCADSKNKGVPKGRKWFDMNLGIAR